MNKMKYKELLKAFLRQGFYFKKFEEFNVNEDSQVILRHDVDFSIQMALQMATLEKELGVRSTYYFLLASDSYNLLSRKNSESIKSIQDMGHSVGLHFDPTAYADEQSGFEYELDVLERHFGRIFSMSFHRPSKSVPDGIDWLPKRIIGAYQDKFLLPKRIIGAYQDKFFTEIAYISDSQGAFRYGHPFEHESFNQCRNMQLLIHPIWWMTDGSLPQEKIQQFLNLNTCFMSEHIGQNCIPWRNRNE